MRSDTTAARVGMIPPVQEALPMPMPVRLGVEQRVMAGAVAVLLLTLLGVARWLEPDPSGVGTHTQLGLPPTFVMEHLGTPCPFCGMTTAWAHTMDADIPSAVLVQPAGTLFALLAILAVPAALAIAVTGWWPRWLGSPTACRWGWRAAVIVLMAGWVYKLSSVWYGFPV